MLDIIKDGSVAQIVLIVIVWGTIALLLGTQQVVPDALFDAGLVIVGFYFGSKSSQAGRIK